MAEERLPSKVILDASVAVKWFFEEDLWEEAQTVWDFFLNGRIKLVVPQLFFFEFANVCARKSKKGLCTNEEAIQALDDLNALSLEPYPDMELVDIALENAVRLRVSAYDGLYLALAEVYVSPLVTADETLVTACRKRFDFIESLRDFQPE